jgi:hypothetical protein
MTFTLPRVCDVRFPALLDAMAWQKALSGASAIDSTVCRSRGGSD